MGKIVARTFEHRDERAMNGVIQKSFKNPAANAYPLPPSRFVVVAELGGKVVGHTSIRPMLFHVGGSIVRAGVLHMVGTDPAYQHKGIGHAMMDKAVETMRSERLVLSFLETPVPGFYASKGWEVVRERADVSIPRAAVDARVAKAPVHVELRDGSLDRLASYVAFRERMASKCWFFVHANEEYMKPLVEKACQGGLVDFFHEIWRGGKLAGYVLGTRDATVKEAKPLRIAVQELALDEYDPALVANVFKELLAFDDEFGAVSAGFYVVPGLAAAMEELGGTEVKVGGNVDMVRINTVKEFLGHARDQLDGGLVAFLNREKLDGGTDVTLDVGGERVLLSCTSGHLVIKDAERSKGDGCAVLPLSRNDFARVVTGQAAPSTIVKEGKARCDQPAVLGQLDAMFPTQPVVINYTSTFFLAHLEEMGINPFPWA
ncbi:MAG: GNAT family N-acetyltransferase [Candidatus Lokiarchaeota archaeon]|nr:GNAT family N-acetyltransferase [Candidatus Lokiarchaeota archaeon]